MCSLPHTGSMCTSTEATDAVTFSHIYGPYMMYVDVERLACAFWAASGKPTCCHGKLKMALFSEGTLFLGWIQPHFRSAPVCHTDRVTQMLARNIASSRTPGSCLRTCPTSSSSGGPGGGFPHLDLLVGSMFFPLEAPGSRPSNLWLAICRGQ